MRPPRLRPRATAARAQDPPRGCGAAAQGECLSLFCLARNTDARRFYERHGFRAAAFPGGAGTEEGEPDVLCQCDAAPPIDQHMTGEPA
jgi:hypothetical protein